MIRKKRSKLRPNPRLRNHSVYKNLRAKWRKQNHLNDLDIFQTRDFSPNLYFQVLELSSIDMTSISETCIYYRSIGRPCPSSEQVLKQCREVKPERMSIYVNHTLEMQFLQLPPKIRGQFRKHGVVIVDFHTDPYYGKLDNPFIVTIPPKQSTHHAYSYLTVDLWCPRGKFTLAILPRLPGDLVETLLFDVLTVVECVLPPKLLIFDGEFATVGVMENLQQRGIKFIARRRISRSLRPHALAYSLTDDWETKRTFRAWTFTHQTSKKATTVQVTFQKVNGELRALAISRDLSLTPEEADKWYACRFHIETDFRDKHLYQARTTSKSLSVRLILFLFATMLWNLWRIFLMLVPDDSKGTLTRIGRWRRRSRTIKRFVLRDVLL